MFLFLVDYVKPLEEVDRWLDAHRAYLDENYAAGLFIASGPRNPRDGGVILCTAATRAEAEALKEKDPFAIHGVAAYRIVEFDATKTAPELTKYGCLTSTVLAHIGLYCSDLERMREFYMRYFNGVCGPKYTNPAKGFASYMVSFGKSGHTQGRTGCRLELMTRESVSERNPQPALGLTHLAFQLGSKAEVDALTERLRADGYTILGEPRRTGDGYYESVVADPEGNHVEITA